MTNRFVDDIQTRHILCFMFLTGFIFVFMIRVNINLAIVGMVRSNASFNTNITDEFRDADNVNNMSSGFDNEIRRPVHEGEFDWDEFQQGLILGSFFYGYMASQIPGGRISELYGMKPVFGLAVLANGILSLVIPCSARIHWILLFMIRVLQGLAQGVMYPALSSCISKWVPFSERATFMSITVQGCSIGPVIALPLCGWILTSWGWPGVFYATGSLAVIWYIFWWYLVYDSPDKHPRISLKEKKYLKESLRDSTTKDCGPLPWKEVFTSFQFWLGAAAHAGSDWGFHTFYTYGPKYIKDALDFDISQSGLLSSLPYLCQYISATLLGVIVDKLLANDRIPVRRIRKISVFFSHCMPGMLVTLLTFIGHDVTLSLVIFTLAVTMLGALTTGHYQNPIDIAPNYAGSLTGIANTLGSLGGILCTTVAGTSLHTYGSPKGWHVTFYVAASVYAVTSIPFIIWAKSKELPWNDRQNTKTPVQVKLIPSRENGDKTETNLLSKNVT